MRKSESALMDPMFVDRWSPRSFLPDPLINEQIAALLEAVRWSPSCFNEQPWRFVYAKFEKEVGKLAAALTGKNALWAPKAPLLLFAFARRRFTHNNER